jgi:hypothetical protein
VSAIESVEVMTTERLLPDNWTMVLGTRRQEFHTAISVFNALPQPWLKWALDAAFRCSNGIGDTFV